MIGKESDREIRVEWEKKEREREREREAKIGKKVFIKLLKNLLN